MKIVREVGYFRSVGVEWVVNLNTASINDVFPTSGSVSFREHEKSANIELFIVDDNEIEFIESFSVTLISTYGSFYFVFT